MERICVLVFVFLFLILCNQVVLDTSYVSHSYFKDRLDSLQSPYSEMALSLIYCYYPYVLPTIHPSTITSMVDSVLGARES